MYSPILVSPSPRGAWIEIPDSPPPESGRQCVALPTEGVDRNASALAALDVAEVSPSPRRAWIEIWTWCRRICSATVALPTEGVDRNNLGSVCSLGGVKVALPTEGVDRNYDTHTLLMAVQVALSNQTPGRHFSSICRGLHDPFSLYCPGQ